MVPILNNNICEELKQPTFSSFIIKFDQYKTSFKINVTASEIFRLCNGVNTEDKIIDLLVQKYNEKRDVVKELVTSFLAQSVQLGNIIYVDEAEKEVILPCKGSREYWTPEALAIELTHKCPLKCKHCYINAGEGTFVDKVRVLELIDECAEMGVYNIQFTGGEPLLHPDFFAFVDNALEKGMMVHIFTCGYICSHEVIKKFDKYSGNRSVMIQVSLDGLEEYHNIFRGVKDSYSKAIYFIEQMVERNIKVSVGTCVDLQSYEELNALSMILKEKGVNVHRISPISKRGRAIESNLEISSQKNHEIKSWIEEMGKRHNDGNFMIFYFEEGQENFSNKYTKNCGLGQTVIKISPEFDVYPCLMSDMKYANIKNQSLKKIQMQYSRIWENIFTPNRVSCNGCCDIELCNNCVNEGMQYCKDKESLFLKSKEELINQLKHVKDEQSEL